MPCLVRSRKLLQLPFRRYDTLDNAIGYAMRFSRSADAVIRVYDAAGNVLEMHERAGEFKEFRSYSDVRSSVFDCIIWKAWDLKRRRNPRSGGRPPSKTKKRRKERQVKKLFLVAFVVSGLAFVPVPRSGAQIEIGTPGIGTGPGVNYGYPHFEYGYYPHGGYYYHQPYSGYYGGPSYYEHHGHQVHYRHEASVGPISTN
jgi:hypothetical protein